MILIVGGIFQGKSAWARKLSGLETEAFMRLCADGRTDDPKAAKGRRCLLNVQEFIRTLMERGEPLAPFLELLREESLQIATIAEVGCGVVPIDKRERDWREEVGRAGQMLAARSDTVYRCQYGILTKIKPLQ